MIFKTKRSYIPVDMEKRNHLVKLVEKESLTIKDAAVQLKINYSTAKHIIKTFKKEQITEASDNAWANSGLKSSPGSGSLTPSTVGFVHDTIHT
jgi:hypothetical protein